MVGIHQMYLFMCRDDWRYSSSVFYFYFSCCCCCYSFRYFFFRYQLSFLLFSQYLHSILCNIKTHFNPKRRKKTTTSTESEKRTKNEWTKLKTHFDFAVLVFCRLWNNYINNNSYMRNAIEIHHSNLHWKYVLYLSHANVYCTLRL